MLNRRSLLLAFLAAPLPLAAAVAQPWWNADAQHKQWERYREEERHRYEARHEHWDEERQHEEWERHQRAEAQREWEREHGPYSR